MTLSTRRNNIYAILDEQGYIIADESCRTNEFGLYAAGDVRQKRLRQVVTAVADGANAVTSVLDDLQIWR